MKMSTLKEKLLSEKNALENDIVRLKRDIGNLERMHELRDDFNFIPKRAEESSPSNATNLKRMETILKLSSLVNGIHFENVEEHFVNSNVHILRGTGSAREVYFDFQVTVAKPLIVQSVLLKFEDEKLEEELLMWKKKYVKQKNFQILMQGISLYSSLIMRMKEVLAWVSDTYPSHVVIESQDLSGCVVKSVKVCEGDEDPVIRVHWKIKWQENEGLMLDRFVIEIGNLDLVAMETRVKWKKFLSANKYSVHDLKNFWIEIMNHLPVI